jgi:hypothetical protein
MNLHGIVAPAIATVNPFVSAIRRRSTGSTTQADGIQVPSFADTTISVQVQALTADNLRQLEGLNIQGAHRAIYANGSILGVVRVAAKGGDLIVFAPGTLPEGDTWLATCGLTGSRSQSRCRTGVDDGC